MADLSITTTQLVQTSDRTKIKHGICGETITAGDVVYLKSSDNKIWRADADASASAAALGIACATTTAANMEVTYQQGGTITIGAAASITAGAIYCVSTNVGKIAPEADLTTADYVTVIGVGNGSNQIVMPNTGPFASGVSHV